ncbi:hypothetical protein [Bradyrhizobium sp. Tv2a-2]|uniref:hypothetical protein n=1 Tax=Bradyrhizobium sp. Tv2a-2 TaxID=113395 RepID=UPI00042988C2|nr:hypothetical protein [Bradyrhizobium sp. Tv2a-2]
MTNTAGTEAGAGRSPALGAADVLALAAAPTFAAMALLNAILGSAQADMICSAAQGSSLSGMVPMYVLMSAFHLAPWFRLMLRRRGRGRSG